MTTGARPPVGVRRGLADLLLVSANARIHNGRNRESIRASLTHFGQVEPIVVQKSSGKIIGGNGRAAVNAAWWANR